MIKPTMKSIVLPLSSSAVWFLGSKVQISFSEPLALFLFGVILIGISNMGRERIKKNKQIPYDAGREFIKSD